MGWPGSPAEQDALLASVAWAVGEGCKCDALRDGEVCRFCFTAARILGDEQTCQRLLKLRRMREMVRQRDWKV